MFSSFMNISFSSRIFCGQHAIYKKAQPNKKKQRKLCYDLDTVGKNTYRTPVN